MGVFDKVKRIVGDSGENNDPYVCISCGTGYETDREFCSSCGSAVERR